MKVDARQVAAFLRQPGKCRAVLLHGDDDGLIHERGNQLTRTIAGSLNDAFNVVELDRENWSRLPDEMTAISMMGGRRVIRVGAVTDAILDAVKRSVSSAGDALIILEAPGLGRGKLRTYMEGADAEVAAIACYPEEGRALHETIRSILGDAGVSADGEATAWLAETIGGDRALLRGELEKLALLVGAGGRITLEAAREGAGDTASSSADQGLLAATQGDPVRADAEIGRALAEDLNAIGLLRMTLGHLQKLHQARLRVNDGMSVAEAVRALRPPVFFKAVPGMTASVANWSSAALERAIEDVRHAEIACKQTGARQDLLVRRLVAGLARQAAQRRTR